jgi:hypothetical protein
MHAGRGTKRSERENAAVSTWDRHKYLAEKGRAASMQCPANVEARGSYGSVCFAPPQNLDCQFFLAKIVELRNFSEGHRGKTFQCRD